MPNRAPNSSITTGIFVPAARRSSPSFRARAAMLCWQEASLDRAQSGGRHGVLKMKRMRHTDYRTRAAIALTRGAATPRSCANFVKVRRLECTFRSLLGFSRARRTIAIHSGFDADPTTHAVAGSNLSDGGVPVRQRRPRRGLVQSRRRGLPLQPHFQSTVAVLRKARRGPRRRRRRARHRIGSGRAALSRSPISPIMGEISSPPAALRHHAYRSRPCVAAPGIAARFAFDDSAEALEKMIDADTKAVFCETVGNPAGNICDIEAIATVAHKHGVPLIVGQYGGDADPAQTHRLRRGHRRSSLTKFMGGHGAAMGGVVVDAGISTGWRRPARFPQFTAPDESYHGAHLCRTLRARGLRGAAALGLSAHHRRDHGADDGVPAAARHRKPWPCASNATSANARKIAEFLRDDPASNG